MFAYRLKQYSRKSQVITGTQLKNIRQANKKRRDGLKQPAPVAVRVKN